MEGLMQPFIWMCVAVVAAFSFIMVFDMFAIWLERKVAGHIQDRLGPMYTGGWHGWAQTLADGMKLILKEDIVPTAADRWLFVFAPYVVFLGTLPVFAVLPFSQKLIAADFNLGIFYVISVSSLVVIGILMAGWGSNNKYTLFGALRSAAQLVSYEIPMAITLITIVLVVGGMGMQEIIRHQATNGLGWGGIFGWHIFRNPFLFIAFFIYYICALAECNRAPFDLAEAESELVSGYFTEYSGMRFAFFFLAEYANMFAVSAIATTLFLGGWQSPFGSFLSGPAWQPVWFVLKAMLLVFVQMWVRWTLPRLRVDQLMAVCWKYLLPIAFFNLIGVGVWMVIRGGI